MQAIIELENYPTTLVNENNGLDIKLIMQKQLNGTFDYLKRRPVGVFPIQHATNLIILQTDISFDSGAI